MDPSCSVLYIFLSLDQQPKLLLCSFWSLQHSRELFYSKFVVLFRILVPLLRVFPVLSTFYPEWNSSRWNVRLSRLMTTNQFTTLVEERLKQEVRLHLKTLCTRCTRYHVHYSHGFHDHRLQRVSVHVVLRSVCGIFGVGQLLQLHPLRTCNDQLLRAACAIQTHHLLLLL